MEFANLGQHCHIIDCKQKDFLPFHCSDCNEVFCLEHRSLQAHGCIGQHKRDILSVSCPICGQSIKYNKSQNIDEVFLEHERNYCISNKGEKLQIFDTKGNLQKQSEKCHETSCRIKLGPSNTFICKSCGLKVCLSHRNAEDHNCPSLKKTKLTKIVTNSAINSQRTQTPQASITNVATVNNRILPNEEFLNRVSAKNKTVKIISQPKPVRLQETTSNVISSPIASNTSTMLANNHVDEKEVCPQCSKRFDNVNDLLYHVESEHESSNTTSINERSDENVCPICCNLRFRDAIALVQHYEEVHSIDTSTNQANRSNNNNSNCLIV